MERDPPRSPPCAGSALLSLAPVLSSAKQSGRSGTREPLVKPVFAYAPDSTRTERWRLRLPHGANWPSAFRVCSATRQDFGRRPSEREKESDFSTAGRRRRKEAPVAVFRAFRNARGNSREADRCPFHRCQLRHFRRCWLPSKRADRAPGATDRFTREARRVEREFRDLRADCVGRRQVDRGDVETHREAGYSDLVCGRARCVSRRRRRRARAHIIRTEWTRPRVMREDACRFAADRASEEVDAGRPAVPKKILKVSWGAERKEGVSKNCAVFQLGRKVVRRATRNQGGRETSPLRGSIVGSDGGWWICAGRKVSADARSRSRASSEGSEWISARSKVNRGERERERGEEDLSPLETKVSRSPASPTDLIRGALLHHARCFGEGVGRQPAASVRTRKKDGTWVFLSARRKIPDSVATVHLGSGREFSVLNIDGDDMTWRFATGEVDPARDVRSECVRISRRFCHVSPVRVNSRATNFSPVFWSPSRASRRQQPGSGARWRTGKEDAVWSGRPGAHRRWRPHNGLWGESRRVKAPRVVDDRLPYSPCMLNDNSTYRRLFVTKARCSAAIMSRTCRCKVRQNRHAASHERTRTDLLFNEPLRARYVFLALRSIPLESLFQIAIQVTRFRFFQTATTGFRAETVSE